MKVAIVLAVSIQFLCYANSQRRRTCGPSPKFENSSPVGYTLDVYPLGHIVNYECDDGYSTGGDYRTNKGIQSHAFCELDYKTRSPIWRTEEVLCIGRCGPPPKLENSSPVGPYVPEYPTGTLDEYPLGHIVNYKCDDGYLTDGGIKAFAFCGLDFETRSPTWRTEEVPCIRSEADVFLDFKCPDYYVGPLPHPTECYKYYLCNSSKVRLETCPGSSLYNPKTLLCEKEELVDCSLRSKVGRVSPCSIPETPNGRIFKRVQQWIYKWNVLPKGTSVRDGSTLLLICNENYKPVDAEDPDTISEKIFCTGGKLSPEPVCKSKGAEDHYERKTTMAEEEDFPDIGFDALHDETTAFGVDGNRAPGTDEKTEGTQNYIKDVLKPTTVSPVISNSGKQIPCSCTYYNQDTYAMAYTRKGALRNNEKVEKNSVVKIFCADVRGQLLFLGNQVTCTENCRWAPPSFPICREPQGTTPEVNRKPFRVPSCSVMSLFHTLPENIQPLLSGIAGDTVPYNSSIQLRCDPDSLVMTGRESVVCKGSLGWDLGSTQCKSRCFIPLSRTTVSAKPVIQPERTYYDMGDSVTLSCSEGKHLSNGIERIVCLTSGWSTPLSGEHAPECVSN